MSAQCGIIGLPNVGKSSLFNLITAMGVEASNYPFCTIDKNVGVVELPDSRLNLLAQAAKSEKIIPTIVQFVDIAGLVAGASKGEGLGNQFLGHIRETDALIHVVRCFDDHNIIHVNNKIDPIADIQTIHTELMLADLQSIEKRLAKYKNHKTLDKLSELTFNLLKKAENYLSEGKLLINLYNTLDLQEQLLLTQSQFLTAKKILYLANIDEQTLENPHNNIYLKNLLNYSNTENILTIPMAVRLEAEMGLLSPDEQQEYLKIYNLTETGLTRLIKAAYKLLNLITFFTAGPQEARAWTITANTLAPQAAGVIHTDFEKHFISAEVVSFNDFIKYGSLTEAKKQGAMRLEGKNYLIQEGDIIYFKVGR